ncbi:ABC transporter ATP-binding protein [Marivirga tractuosa]|uniref:ABC transporter related protein n=1 Tax=Marivirga tractuosa (strain ATCC 23168 / DSM 4126 / NBRC 15989 / NCIMB 1408 / VKM B-1430 / H-43) TaxID=643867 RepID=E4TVU6_MARTH|nr:ABC transporter ATP-binding protein [Marivirga tractuosa]ADR22194.1 ABC transporter related protein [Marivirga tractuosa DSM 4126]BDD13340.1 ABC transporter ATP-binding protein [Marivirga tractuosa]
MTDTAISVQGLGKQYIIGHKKEGDFRHAIGNKLRNIFKPDASEKEVFWALKDIDFEIKKGEAVGIIGRNGAGKSTLLKILSRITDPSTGRFEINGRVSSLLEVGTGFHPELSGRENIYLNGTILGMKRAEIRQKFDEIVDFSGVEKFLDTPVKHYSSGMKVRLAFSVAAHLEPEILIVDEVLAVGDAEFQKKCLGKMDQVTKTDGRTIVFVSHNMGAVQNLCSRGVYLKDGLMEFKGGIEATLENYMFSVNNQIKSSEWINDKESDSVIHLKRCKIKLIGKQPNLILEINTEIASNKKHNKLFVAYDITSASGTPIFQSIPIQTPFIEYNLSLQIVTSKIELPKLIPGLYSVSVWFGEHFSRGVLWEKEIVNFEIENSPELNRTYPHNHKNGFLIEKSDVTITQK